MLNVVMLSVVATFLKWETVGETGGWRNGAAPNEA